MDKIRKINITGLIQLLEILYDKGIDYIDISGKQMKTEGEDLLSISFAKDYMNEEFREHFEEFDEEEFSDAPNFEGEERIEVKLTDDDLNQLI